VAMADGYAQASGQPALINLHVAPGLGNAMGVLFTALKNRAPLIVTCGQQDTRHIFHEPLLSGDLVGMARPVTKWAYEVKHAADVPDALEQAYHLAMTPPRGPVFVSIPDELLGRACRAAALEDAARARRAAGTGCGRGRTRVGAEARAGVWGGRWGRRRNRRSGRPRRETRLRGLPRAAELADGLPHAATRCTRACCCPPRRA
jgi:hypothetical protein